MFKLDEDHHNTSLACRGCLATDVDLYHIIGCGLKECYEAVVGLTILINDTFPQYLCTLCKAYLVKCFNFRRRCRISFDLLKEANENGRLLTTGFIRAIDRSFYNLGCSLNCSDITRMDCFEPNEEEQQQSHKEIPNTDIVKDKEIFEDIHYEDNHNEYTPEPDEEVNPVKHKVVVDDSYNFFTADESIANGEKTSHKISPLTRDELVDYAKIYNHVATFFTEEEQFRNIEEKKHKVLENSRAYYCHECYNVYISEEKLVMHLKNKHDPNIGNFICKFCKCRFKRRHRFNSHLQTHSHRFTCRECGAVTINKHNIKNHYEGHIGMAIICHKCGKVFQKKCIYLNHVRLHHMSDFWCSICGESFICERGVHQHKNLVHKDVTLDFKCKVCNKEFVNKNALKNHKVLDQCDLPSCVHCGNSFANEMLLKYHLIRHTKEGDVPKMVECGNCDVKFINEAALKCHEPDCGDGKLPCLICGQNFDTEEQLYEHSKDHDDDILKCEKCDRKFKSAYKFRIHYKLHQNKHFPNSKSGKMKIIPGRRIRIVADETLIRYAALFDFDVKFLSKEEQFNIIEEKRRNIHSSKFKCHSCGKNFRNQQSFDNHHQMHHDARIGDHVCDICHMRFKSKYKLVYHLRSHRSIFSCRKCEYITHNFQKLKEHRNLHQGTRYVCQYCNKDFLKHTTYMSHVRIRHANELSWCELCGESFIGEKGIKTHKLKAHIGELEKAEYVCTSCNKAFFFKFALKKHESLKRCDLSSCVKCGDSFMNQQLLKYHLVQQHRNESVPQALKCENCKVTFLNVAALRRHAGECGDGQWSCVQCGENFYAEKELSEHVREQHDSGNEFKCEECNKTFLNAFYYREHYKVHLKRIKRSIKDQDSKTIKRRENATIKEQVQKKKNHLCPYCNMVFSSSMYLKQHENIFHNEVNDFSDITVGHAISKHIDIKERRPIVKEERLIEDTVNMNEEYTDIEDEGEVKDETEIWNEQEEISLDIEKETEEEMEIEELENDEVEYGLEEDTLVEYDDTVSYIEVLDESILEDQM